MMGLFCKNDYRLIAPTQIEAVVCRCSSASKQVFLKIQQISQENTSVGVFFNKVTGLTLLKDTPTQVFSCEFYEIFKNTLFKRTRPVASSAQMLDKVLITPQFTDVIYESNQLVRISWISFPRNNPMFWYLPHKNYLKF